MLRNIFGGNSSGSDRGSEFLGQHIDLGQQKLRVKKVLGEGSILFFLKSFCSVYCCQK